MNTTTPETDTLRDSLWNLVERTSVSFHVEQFLKLARKLERERDDARKQSCEPLFSQRLLPKVIAERDQLRKVADDQNNKISHSLVHLDMWFKSRNPHPKDIEFANDLLHEALNSYNQLPHVQERNK